jgi:peptidylprolyl isomerase
MRAFAGTIAAVVLLGGCTGAGIPEPAAVAPQADAGTVFSSASGLKYADIAAGTGAFPKAGQICVVHYTGWLYRNGRKGAKFDSSLDRGKPFEFQLGRGKVIRGWDEGVATMKVGGRRTLVIPPDLGYGHVGTPGIPPHSTLLFEVELLAVKG